MVHDIVSEIGTLINESSFYQVQIVSNGQRTQQYEVKKINKGIRQFVCEGKLVY
jgi:hypothetical protein